MSDIVKRLKLHNANVDKMEAHHLKTGKHIDPVTGVEMPKTEVGTACCKILLKRDPNRYERRLLWKWRKSVQKGYRGEG
jgi:hypothetical protein